MAQILQIPGRKDNGTDGRVTMERIRSVGLCLQKPATPVFTYNSSQQKDFCGKERIRLRFKTASREDGFLDKVADQRTCLRLFVMIS